MNGEGVKPVADEISEEKLEEVLGMRTNRFLRDRFELV